MFSYISFPKTEPLTNYTPEFSGMRGIVTNAGVSFSFPTAGANTYTFRDGAAGLKTLTVPTDLFAVDKVYTLVNTLWGRPGSSLASVEFVGDGGRRLHRQSGRQCRYPRLQRRLVLQCDQWHDYSAVVP